MTMGAVAFPVAEIPAHPLRKKLWLGAGALTLAILKAAVRQGKIAAAGPLPVR